MTDEIIIPKEEKPKVGKKFKDYYQDPEYRKKHREYILQKVECDLCHVMVMRANMGHHRATMKHKRKDAERKQSLPNEEQLKKAVELTLKILQENKTK